MQEVVQTEHRVGLDLLEVVFDPRFNLISIVVDGRDERRHDN
jgi:hypothetical protein